MRFLLVCLVSVVLSGCGGFDTEAMFSQHATALKSGEVRALKGGKVSCLHCPMYFAFDTDSALTENIISRHHLRPIAEATPEILEILGLVKREAPWWEMTSPEQQDKTFWVEHKPTHPALEAAFRLLVVRSNRSFFVTSGHFDSAYYASEG